jgi:cupin 2 domain-containing protein
LSVAGDPLERLALVTDFELVRAELEAALDRSDRAAGGRPPYDAVPMFKVPALQTLSTLPAAQTEDPSRDPPSFMRLLGLALEDRRPEAKTIRCSSAPERLASNWRPAMSQIKKAGNLFDDLPERRPEENFSALLDQPGFRLERIVSTGQATPSGTWYDQPQSEWVVLLTGSAGLLIAGEPEARQLKPGDWILIPAGVRHRVEWTDPDRPTVWLALHYGR